MSLELQNSDRRDADSALLRARRRVFPWLLMLSFAATACDDSASANTEEDRDPASDEETRDAARPPSDAGNGGQASDAGNGGQASDAASGGGGQGCTRERLTEMVDDYFRALAGQDPSQLTVAQNVKFTENGTVHQLGQGTLWTTAGELSFRRRTALRASRRTRTRGPAPSTAAAQARPLV